MSALVRSSSKGALLSVRVQPRAGRDEIIGPHGDTLKIRLKAAPVDGAANKALLKFLGKQLRLPPSSIQILRGHSGREKLLCFSSLKEEALKDRLGFS